MTSHSQQANHNMPENKLTIIELLLQSLISYENRNGRNRVELFCRIL